MKTIQHHSIFRSRVTDLIFTVTLFLFVALGSPSFAEKIGWNDSISLHAGDGVDLKDQQEAKAAQVVMMSPNAVVDPNSTGSATESFTIAQHTFDLVSSLNVNAQVSLHGTTFGGNAGVTFINSHKFSVNSIDYVFTAVRDFGDSYFPKTPDSYGNVFSSDFTTIVANLRKSYTGQALHDAITRTFGTHVVTGKRSACMVSVIFSFDYGSASLAQSLMASAGGSFSFGGFSSQVDSFFKSSDTRRKLNYEFYSTDPYHLPTNANFSVSGSFTNLAAFQGFYTNIENYWKSMDPNYAKTTSYILEPIQNMPGYLSIIGTTPTQAYPADYPSFLQVYSKLQTWNQRLTDWALDPKKMSWLSSDGQRQVLAKRLDVANYDTVMRTIAASHFTNNTPLIVPTDVFNYLATLNDITIPSINVAWASDDTVYTSYHGLIGWVDCGSKSNTMETPFANISEQLNGTDVGWQAQLAFSYHDVTNLVATQISWWSARNSTMTTDLKQFFAGSTWAALTNAAFSTHRIGFFGDQRARADKTNTFMILADAEGNTVDQLNWQSTRSGGVPATNALSFNNVSVSVKSTANYVSGRVATATEIPLTVTNSGLTSAYGVTTSFQLDPRFEFAGSNGSQGYASFNPTNRQVTYVVGPLPARGHADVAVRVVPLEAGLLDSGGNAGVAVGDMLTNGTPSVASLPPVSSDLPVLNLAKAVNGLELTWISDTERLKTVQSARLPSSVWTTVTDAPLVSGNRHTLTVPTTGPNMFYRLEIQ